MRKTGEVVHEFTMFGDVVPIFEARAQFRPVGWIIIPSVVELRPSLVGVRIGEVAGNMVGEHGGGCDDFR